MKIRIDNGKYFNTEYFQRFMQKVNDVSLGSKDLQEFLAEQKGKKNRTIVLNTAWFMPLLFGYQTDLVCSYEDKIFRIFYDSQRPFVDLLAAGYKNKEYSIGFAMRRIMGAGSPEHLDVTEVMNEGGYTKFFNKTLSLHPFQTLLYKSDRKEIDVIDYFNPAISA